MPSNNNHLTDTEIIFHFIKTVLFKREMVSNVETVSLQVKKMYRLHGAIFFASGLEMQNPAPPVANHSFSFFPSYVI